MPLAAHWNGLLSEDQARELLELDTKIRALESAAKALTVPTLGKVPFWQRVRNPDQMVIESIQHDLMQERDHFLSLVPTRFHKAFGLIEWVYPTRAASLKKQFKDKLVPIVGKSRFRLAWQDPREEEELLGLHVVFADAKAAALAKLVLNGWDFTPFTLHDADAVDRVLHKWPWPIQ